MTAFLATEVADQEDVNPIAVDGVPLSFLAVALLDAGLDHADPTQDLEFWITKHLNLDAGLVDDVVYVYQYTNQVCAATAFSNVAEVILNTIQSLTERYDDRVGEAIREFTYAGWYISLVYCLSGTDVIIELERYENGDDETPTSLLHRLCSSENVPTQYFRTETPESSPNRRSVRVGLF